MATYKVGEIIKITNRKSRYYRMCGVVTEVSGMWFSIDLRIPVQEHTSFFANQFKRASDKEALKWRLTR